MSVMIVAFPQSHTLLKQDRANKYGACTLQGASIVIVGLYFLPSRGLCFILWRCIAELCARFICAAFFSGPCRTDELEERIMRGVKCACPTCVLWTSQAFLFICVFLACDSMSSVTCVLCARFLWWELRWTSPADSCVLMTVPGLLLFHSTNQPSPE